ncbi:hypothetical protein [Fimbriiglobus ruber]|uniref:Uncharacterized protein n=1 Tax=Fimbriiglobus ruber TaxID=1908690 RepID=A0A225DYQ7_9BACT|nr:hypothetical protein [Fimbriiglobus ruber]OWK43668.1 hypothetical protein FRUB_03267 [Fimbriiglobus ruber]
MGASLPYRWVWACVLLGVAAGAVAAQSPSPPQSPAPFLPTAPLVPPVNPAHPAYVPPGSDGPFWIDSAALDPPGQELGWYAVAEAGLLKPHLSARLTTPGPLTSASPNPLFLGAAPLDWTGVPNLGLGYRFDRGAGELFVNYRLVASSGTETVAGFDAAGAGLLKSRLNLNTVDIDYILPEFLGQDAAAASPWFRRELRAGFGLRATSAFFDTVGNGAETLESKASSSFGGAGIHALFEYRQQIADRPLWLYTRMNTAGLLGKIRQQFAQTTLTNGTGMVGGYDTGYLSNGMGQFGVEAGLSWADTIGGRNFRLTAAYTWERWWDFGNTNQSNAELTLQGFVLRAELGF